MHNCPPTNKWSLPPSALDILPNLVAGHIFDSLVYIFGESIEIPIDIKTKLVNDVFSIEKIIHFNQSPV